MKSKMNMIHHTANDTYLASNQVAKEDELLRDRQHQRSQGGDVGLEGMSSNGHELLGQVHSHPTLNILPLIHTTVPARQHKFGQRHAFMFEKGSRPASVRVENDVCTAVSKQYRP